MQFIHARTQLNFQDHYHFQCNMILQNHSNIGPQETYLIIINVENSSTNYQILDFFFK